MIDTVRRDAAEAAQDNGRLGFRGRSGDGAALLENCARAVRIASRKVERAYSVPAVSADERAEYSGELAARLVGENDGYLPKPDAVAFGYMVRRAQGIIMNDRSRYGLDIDQPAQGEAGADGRLTGPLSIPPEVAAAADSLDVTETARRAFVAAVVPATREEWADFWRYANPDAWHRTAKRGRIELRMIGEDVLRQALRRAEADATNRADVEVLHVREIIDGMEEA